MSLVPTNDWTLPQLGEFVATTARKTGEAYHRMGTALTIAKNKCQHGGWAEWCAEYVPFIHPKMIYRLRKIAELPLKDVKGVKISAVYKMIAAPVKGEATEATTTTPETETPTTTTKPTPEPDAIGEDSKPTPDTGADTPPPHALTVVNVPSFEEQLQELQANEAVRTAVKLAVEAIGDAIGDAIDVADVDTDAALLALAKVMIRKAA